MEFDINGQRYSAAKLGVFEQFKVARKLLPVLAGMFAGWSSEGALPSNGREPEGAVLSPAMLEMLPNIAQALSDLSDEDCNAVLYPCLTVVSRQNGTLWTPIFNSGSLMFTDIDMLTMLQIVARVIGDSLGNFLPARPTKETPPLASA